MSDSIYNRSLKVYRLMFRISLVSSLNCNQAPTLKITDQGLVFALGSGQYLVLKKGGGGLKRNCCFKDPEICSGIEGFPRH